MPPAVIGAALAVGGAVASGISKDRAAKKAGKTAAKNLASAQAEGEAALKFKEQNPYEIPDIIKNQVALATHEAGNSTLQTNLERLADNKLARNVGHIKKTATSSADALAALAHAEYENNEEFTAAAAAGAQERQGDLQNLYRAQGELGSYENIQYDQNINMPFLQRMELAQGRIGAAGNQVAMAEKAKAENAGWIGSALGQAGSSLVALDGAGVFK